MVEKIIAVEIERVEVEKKPTDWTKIYDKLLADDTEEGSK